jgi:hypothetical protein
MAETFRKGKIEDFLYKLRVRKAILRNQLKAKEFYTTEQFIQGQMFAVDTIIQELADEFDLHFPERIKKTDVIESKEIPETEWMHSAAKNPAFDFLSDLEEDIYTLEDGKAIHDKK